MKGSVASDIYSGIVSRRKQIILALAVLTFILVIANIVMFIKYHSASEAFKALVYPDLVPNNIRNLVWVYRIPETMFALLVGMGLAMAGMEMQTVLNNPLADSYTLGISMAAAFGASVVLGFGVGTAVLGQYSVLLAAFLSSMVSCAVIYYVAKRTSNRTTIVLVGVALLFLFQALVNLVQSVVAKEASNAIMFWMFGSLSRYTDYNYIYLLAAVILLVGALFMSNMWKLSALKLGDSKVSSLGVDVNKLRRNMIVGVSLISATCVSFTGTIGFVGLVGPHMARMLVGDDQRYLLPLSALCGAVMLLLSSLLLKVLPYGGIPIGVVTSLVGVPFFLYLLHKQKGVMGA